MYVPPYGNRNAKIAFAAGIALVFGVLISLFITGLLATSTDYFKIVKDRGFTYVSDQPNGTNGKRISVQFGTSIPICTGTLIVPDDNSPVVLEVTPGGWAAVSTSPLHFSDPWAFPHDGGANLTYVKAMQRCFSH